MFFLQNLGPNKKNINKTKVYQVLQYFGNVRLNLAAENIFAKVVKVMNHKKLQLAGLIEYTDCISAEW